MTPARSLAASVVALGFAGSLTAPLPATAAPAPCERAENFAAQSGAELLRIDRLEVRPTGGERPVTKTAPTESTPAGATDRILGANATPLDPADGPGDVDGDTLSEGIGDAGVAVLDSLLPGGVDTLTNSPSLLGSDDLTPGDLAATGEDTGGMGGGSVMSAQPGDGVQAGGGNRADGGSQAGGGSQVGEGNAAAEGNAAGEGNVAGEGERAGDKGKGDQGDGGRGGGESGDNTGSGSEGNGSKGNDDVGDAAKGGAGNGGKAAVLRGIGLGEARTALVGTADVKSAAIARLLDAADGKDAWTRPIVQQAPPSNARPAIRETPAGRIGPLQVGAGEISAHARWDAGMACGSTAGEAARSVAELRGASLLGSGDNALVRVPEKVTSLSTTALERRGGTPRSVAATTMTAGRFELAGGQVRVRVLRSPSLVAEMSVDGGEVRYRPALIEVSGPGITTKRLSAAGDHLDVTLDQDRRAAEAGISGLGDLRPGSALPLPAIPGLPRIAPVIPETPLESATTGTKLRISLGRVRQAEKGHAIAARATAIKVSVTQGGAKDGRGKDGYAGASSSLDLTIGLMEAAAVAPGTAAANGTSGTAGGLPITGPRAGGLAIGGIALLVAGIAAVALSVRRRRSRP